MAKPGDVIDVPELGVRVVFLATSESTDGAYTEVDVIGNPKGFITVGHVHVGVTEHHTVLEGTMRVKLDGRSARPAGPARRSRSRPTRRTRSSRAARRSGQIRIRLTPSARSDEFFERLAQLDYNRFGFPKPRSGAKFVRELGEAGHAARPSLKTQQRLGGAARRRVHVRRRGTSPRRARTSSTRWPTARPTRPGGSRSTSTPPTTASTRSSTSRAACPITCTRAHARPTPSVRTASRARPTATCAAPGSGR